MISTKANTLLPIQTILEYPKILSFVNHQLDSNRKEHTEYERPFFQDEVYLTVTMLPKKLFERNSKYLEIDLDIF